MPAKKKRQPPWKRDLARLSRAAEAPRLDDGRLFAPFATGVFPAAPAAGNEESGYASAWLRDNVLIADALWRLGRRDRAVATYRGLARFLATQERKILAILEDPALGRDPRRRPHVRFDGRRLTELPGDWSHKQNDALGYFLWLGSRLLRTAGSADSAAARQLGLLAALLAALEYWRDEDSGHWEETPKISASSIGTVVAGLSEAAALAKELGGALPGGPLAGPCSAEWLESLAAKGREALAAILPAENVQDDPAKNRPCDAALLFLSEPLRLLDPGQTLAIVSRVREKLEGEIGIRRYLLDSYWSPDYREHFPPATRTAEVSQDSSHRDRFAIAGKEAQWCLFDSILSVVHSRLQTSVGMAEHGDLQVHHLERALRQKTPAGMPEAYFWEHGRLVPNDHVPLLWAEGNLRIALAEARAVLG
jgi:hypothetical protein